MAAKKIRKGSAVDGWRIERRLGGGGNGTVWKARREGQPAALKILKEDSRYRRARFAAEVEVMLQYREHPGVLPLIDHKIPDPSSNAEVWLATEIAQEVRTALGPAPAVRQVVETVHAYAVTLAELATDGVAHRDLKPENLFKYSGRWVVGDFGLATYPSKTALTQAHRRLGPLYYLAPEMLDRPDQANPGLPDVYSLGKTLWVLSTHKRDPVQGQLRLDVPKHRIATWLTEGTDVAALDLLIERATSDEPLDRGTMRDFADDLETWLAGGGSREDQVAVLRRGRHLDAVRELLADSVDPDDVQRVEEAARSVAVQANIRVAENRRRLQQEGFAAREAAHRQTLRANGVAVVAAINNSPWIGSVSTARDFADAVLYQPENKRQQEIHSVWEAVEATYARWVSKEQNRCRPLWWLHTVLLGGCLELRGKPGCEPAATEVARRELANHLMGFAREPLEAASWGLQRVLIPAVARATGLAPIDQMTQAAQRTQTAEDRIRYAITPTFVFMTTVREAVQRYIAQIEPWTAQRLTEEAQLVAKGLSRTPVPERQWYGPGGGDAWLVSWAHRDPVLMCGLAALDDHPSGDDLLDDPEIVSVIIAAAEDEDGLLRRPALPLAQRLGLRTASVE